MALYKNYSKKEKKKRYLRDGIIMLVLLLLAITTLFPIYYMIISSFGEPVEAGAASYSILLRNPTLNSYKFFFDYSKYSYRWIMNSFIVAGVVTVTNVLFATTAGYAFAKLRFAGNKVIFFIILVAMMIPYQVTQVPLYILVVNVLKVKDTYFALVAPSLVTAYNIFLAKQFIGSLPSEIIEAAKIEGCSQPKLLVKIIMPLSKTVMAVMAITTFMGSWNTFFWPFLVTSEEKMQTIQVGLKNFSFANTTYFAPMMAGATVSALPMFILFFSLQKYFLEGVTVGAVKG
ncbi:MAG TPA: sugar ABC transporter permease [Lachnospiraceae bacterium]|jgi:multiple sugar transport system permease protein|nr:sugar ABC transporter permease [Lachnospiraceae bacterium]HBY72491.1 sugar ABC transporter permease [Lachnospiraceae bacterium]HCA70270.1 sugar ABC transporter permease [Lachnospiraceae bacterium]HCM12134.1 sugar ABC transporter permease [Lachnospiraceae bacterium]HCR41671.1 sugar ABC transporter permease [Lachnospiraceae bacterium]